MSHEFFIRAIEDATPYDPRFEVEYGVGWTHVREVGPRSWIYMTQVNAGAGCDDISTYSIRVSRRGAVRVKLLKVEAPFQS